jgi:hypothetical protein
VNPLLPCLNVTICPEFTFLPPTRTSDTVCVPYGAPGSVDVVFGSSYSSVASAADNLEFSNLLYDAVMMLDGLPDPIDFIITLSPGSIVANITVSNNTALPTIYTTVENSRLAITWDGAVVTAFFDDNHGPCGLGNVSITAQKPCIQCSAGTYVSINACLACMYDSLIVHLIAL